MSSEKASYRSIMKGTAIFGGVQVFNILIGIVRGKLVAILLGAAGMGITSLYAISCNVIQQFASLGLNVSSVRDISKANEEGNIDKVSSIVKALRRIILISALIGALFTIIFSGWLSKITFGNYNYQWGFVFLSSFVFISLLSGGENAILQGCRRLKSLALRDIAGSVCGLAIGVPLYFYYGTNGIVPAMIISALVIYVFARVGTNKIPFNNVRQSLSSSWAICKTMMVIGVLMTIGICLGNVAQYSIVGSIRLLGSIKDVGLYNAANSITQQSCGLVFTAMATDYFPRLSGKINDKQATLDLVRQQTELVVLIVAPIATLIILISPLLIRILLTKEFLVTINIVRFLGYGIIFKAFCFPMGYLAVAKGDKMYYFLTEGIWTNIKTPALFISFYYLWGFKGLGYAALADALINTIVISVLTKWRYNIYLKAEFYKLVAPLMIGSTLCFVVSFVDNNYISYSLMTVLSLVVITYSLYQLDKRVSIMDWLNNKIKIKFHNNK